MGHTLFLLFLVLTFALIFWWAFTTLPQERWQIFATLPIHKGSGTQWTGLNLTYYGILTACSVTFSVMVFAILMASNGSPTVAILAFILIVLSVAVPSAKILARLVEKKLHTFTIGGASFVGMVAAPLVILLLNALHPGHWASIPLTSTLAALWVAYAFGEGMGRLACISFGCCYGKPLSNCHPIYQNLFRQLHFKFSGSTKKAVYEAGLEFVPLIPIQGMTAVINVSAGLLGLSLFLSERYILTVCVVAIMTQLWRVASESMRADFRGEGKITQYQWMALFGGLYSILFTIFWPDMTTSPPNMTQGFLTVLSGPFLFLLQALWIVIFLFTGRSHVTGAVVSFHVQHEKI